MPRKGASVVALLMEHGYTSQTSSTFLRHSVIYYGVEKMRFFAAKCKVNFFISHTEVVYLSNVKI